MSASLVIGITGCTSAASGPVQVLPSTPSPVVSTPAPAPPAPPDPATLPLRGADGSGNAITATEVQAVLKLPGAAVLVTDAATGKVLLDRSSTTPVSPASTTKLLTAAAALTVLGGDTRLTTSVSVTRRPDASGAVRGDLVVVGGGDPTLTTKKATDGRANLEDLAAQVAASGVRHVTGRIIADTSLFTSATFASGWVQGYVSGGSVAPVQSLEVDGGRVTPGGRVAARVAVPALSAAQRLRVLLRAAGVVVDGPATVQAAPAGSVVLTAVQGLSVNELVVRMLRNSDNDIAECLGRLVSLKSGGQASPAGAGKAVLAAIQRIGVPITGSALADTSGLSPQDRLTGRVLVDLLSTVVTGAAPRLRPIFTAMPLAGRSGTLDVRFRSGPSRAGWSKVRAKTGAIAGTTTLAGVAPTQSGRLLLFSFAYGAGVSRSAAESAMDVAAAALTRIP